MLFLKAFVVGLIFSTISIGPITLLGMQRTFMHGWRSGAIAAAGSTLADFMYAAIPAFGVTLITGFLESHTHWVHGAAGVLLVVFGLYFARARLDMDNGHLTKKAIFGDFGLGFMLNFLNPANMFTYMLAFAFIGIEKDLHGFSVVAALAIAFGVACGSALSWALRIWLFSYLRGHMAKTILEKVTHYMGIALVIFGAGILLRMLFF